MNDEQKLLEEVFKHQSVLDDYTDDELLYWSTPYFDELQAMKAKREKEIEEENGKN